MADVPDPEPGPGEVRLRVSACGICHTDLHIVEGELPSHKSPVVPGHQIVGTVDKLGQGTTSLKLGERVGIPWLHSSCGECSFCREGKENLCPNANFTGYDVDGGYAQYTVVSQAFACPLPEGFPDLEVAPLLCAGIIGFRSLRSALSRHVPDSIGAKRSGESVSDLSEIEPGQRLGLYGFGAAAHIAIQVAVHWKCEVYVFTRGPEHQALARKLGAVWTGKAEDMPPRKLHSAIIFAPAGSIVPYALEALERGGVLALGGIYMSPVPSLDYTRHLYHEKTVRSVTNATRQDARDFLRLAAEIPIHTEVEVFPLEEANRALLLLRQGKIRGAGVLRIP